MPQMDDEEAYKERVGLRARRFRLAKGWTQEEVAHAIKSTQPKVANLENGKHLPKGRFMRDLATLFKVPIEAITADPEIRSLFPATVSGNKKALGFCGITVDQVYIAVGSASDTLDISVRYADVPFRYPDRIARVKERLETIAARHAEVTGAMHWDGPTARLLKYRDATADTAAAYERRKLVIDAGPLSWFEFLVCNTFLDTPGLFSGGTTIRDNYTDLQKLVRRPDDLSWYELGNILQVAMTPITTDGYGIITRSRAGIVPATAGKLTSGVAENAQRWLDECAPDDKWEPIHPFLRFAELPPEGKRRDYQPRAISPYVTGLRGLKEELSVLRKDLGDPRRSVKFLCLAWDLVLFHSILVGVIELPFDRSRAERLINEQRGKDHSEWSDLHFLRLDFGDDQTIAKIVDTTDWDVGGLASFVTAVQYWEGREG